MQDPNAHAEAIGHIADAATKISGGTSVGLVAYSGITLQEWGVICGIVLGFLTFITNLYFRREMLKVAKGKTSDSEGTG